MKAITGYWSKCDSRGEVVKVMIKDESAMTACNRNTQIGWTVKEAVKKFNDFLNFFGYEITHVEHWNGDEYA
jgi:hypothetical protein